MPSSVSRRRTVAAALVVAFLIAGMAADAQRRRTPVVRGTVPAPKVTGPVASAPVGDAGRNYPFSSSIVDLAVHGYVETEFFVEGTANRYSTPPQTTGTVTDGGHPYKTRFVVRRPRDAAKFNGVVVVEWNNVTAGYDLDIDWFQSYDYFMRTGTAWVGVTPQRVGVAALKAWSPSRYGTLDVTKNGAIEGDALSYDIFSQVAQAVRSNGAVLGGMKAQHVFATGHSQSAGRLGTYVNSVHPIAPVFDGIVLHGGGDRVRVDSDVPVIKLLAETDVLGRQAGLRQSNTASFRSWEVAGTSHVDERFVASSRPLRQRDGAPAAQPAAAGRGGRGTATGAQSPSAAAPIGTSANPGGCDRPPYSHIPFHYVMNAAFDHLVRWVRDDEPPPAAPPIDTDAVGPPVVLARDARGNASGGIQLPHHAVPTGVNTGQNSGPGFCGLIGPHVRFAAATGGGV